MKNSPEKPLGLEWCTTLKNLGIHFSCNQEIVSSKHFQEKLDKIQKVISLEYERFVFIWESDNWTKSLGFLL